MSGAQVMRQALATLEGRVRNSGRRAAAPASSFGPHLAAVVRESAGETFLQIAGRADVDGVITAALAVAQARTLKAVDVAALAGRRLGIVTARARWAELGLPYRKAPEPSVSAYQEAVRERVRQSYQQGRGELLGLLEAAYGQEGQTPAQRGTAVRRALEKWGRGMRQRASYAASGAMRRGFHDTMGAWAEGVVAEFPAVGMTKTWRTTSAMPCPCCVGLDGVTVAVGEEFPHPTGCAVFGDLKGPGMHPNCRCELVYALTAVAEKIKELDAVSPLPALPLPGSGKQEQPQQEPEPPGVTTGGVTVGGFPALSAAQVRAMPSGPFRKLVRFFLAAAKVIRKALGRSEE